jgi:UPF0176 protein
MVAKVSPAFAQAAAALCAVRCNPTARRFGVPSARSKRAMMWTVSAFYKFVALDDTPALRTALLDFCQERGIKGTILLATEGINGTVAGSAEAIGQLEAFLRSDVRFAGLETKRSAFSEAPFQRFKVKLKPEIVTFGVQDLDPGARVGTYVEAQDWNALISDPSVTLIDTRNAYEVSVGTFPGAIDPKTAAFSEFPEFVEATLDPKTHKRIAMFCTGGIRCEKASAYLLSRGFETVYHLRGGILKYLETVPEPDSIWQGSCFVFDERVSLEHALSPGSHALCTVCGQPFEPEKEKAQHQCSRCRASQL